LFKPAKGGAAAGAIVEDMERLEQDVFGEGSVFDRHHVQPLDTLARKPSNAHHTTPICLARCCISSAQHRHRSITHADQGRRAGPGGEGPHPSGTKVRGVGEESMGRARGGAARHVRGRV